MSTTRRVSIDARDLINVTIQVDGHDITNAVRGYVLSHERPGDVPSLLLDIPAPTYRTTLADQDVVVDMPAATYDALVALGWTPPDEPVAADGGDPNFGATPLRPGDERIASEP